MGELRRIHAFVSGRVQGVLFRSFVKEHAEELGLVGFVRNLYDGRVEVVAEGEKEKLEELIELLHVGPPHAVVEKVEVEWQDYTGDFDSFNIRYGLF